MSSIGLCLFRAHFSVAFSILIFHFDSHSSFQFSLCLPFSSSLFISRSSISFSPSLTFFSLLLLFFPPSSSSLTPHFAARVCSHGHGSLTVNCSNSGFSCYSYGIGERVSSFQVTHTLFCCCLRTDNAYSAIAKEKYCTYK